MKEVDIIRTLARSARLEAVPQVQAIPGVLAALRSARDDERNPLLWIAGIASAAAVPLALLGFFALESILNPLIDEFWVLRWTL